MPLPTGTVTFLFTDIEGSTKLWQDHPAQMQSALARHDAILRQAIEAHKGYVFKTVGDAFCAVFSTAPEAVAAALAAQKALQTESWPHDTPIRVRIGLHTGNAQERDNDYFGATLNRVARLMAAAHGGQTLLSLATQELTRDQLPVNAGLSDLGEVRLKDLDRPERVFQLLHPDLPAEFPPLRSLEAVPNNLPQQLTSFIGREQEMEEIKQLVESDRLVSLTGPGGSGKSRLALQVAADLLEHFPSGVWLVELASLSDPALAPQAVASTLGVREAAGQPLIQTLIEWLKTKTLLLILDNCEHLLEACAQLAEALLRSCPRLQLLATSRERLAIAGERAFRVPTLAIPDTEPFPSPERLSQYEAVRLFVDRAVAVVSNFTVTPQNAFAVAGVCQRLDGIPLAIELASARVRAMTVEEIYARLDNRFRLLTGGNRTVMPRQQTLRALIDWSYDLLTHREQMLLCRLSVFAGGWSLEAVEAVCADEEIEGWEGLDLMTGLVDKSLVIAEAREDRTRYRLLETVRQYAAEKLQQSGQRAEVRHRHCDYFLSLAEAAEPQLIGSEQRRWLQQLETEHDNLRAALEWSLEKQGIGDRVSGVVSEEERERGREEEKQGGGEQGTDNLNTNTRYPTPDTRHPAEAGLRFAVALWRFWEVRGYYSEGRAYLAKVRAREAPAGRTQIWAKALDAAGMLAFRQGDYLDARALFEQSLAVRRELGDELGIASSLNGLGLVAQEQGDYEAARALFEQSLAIDRELDDRRGIAASLNNLGMVAERRGDYESAQSLYQQVLAIARQLEDKQIIALSLLNQGAVAYRQGDYTAARALFEESLAIQRELANKGSIALSLTGLGTVARARGDYSAAKSLLEECLAVFREIEHKEGAAHSLNGLGNVMREQGDYETARALYEQGLAIFRELGNKRGIALSLNGLGNTSRAQGDYEAAETLYKESLALRRELGDKRGIAHSLCNLGLVASLHREYGTARALFEESLTIERELEDKRGIAASLQAFAALAVKQNHPERGAQLWGAAQSLREVLGSPLPPNEREEYDRNVAVAREALGDEMFTAMWAAGRAMTLEQAYEYALQDSERYACSIKERSDGVP